MEELNVHNSGFRPDTMLEVTGEEYAILAGSIEQMFYKNIQYVRPLKYRYYDEKEELVLSPSLEDIESGKVRKVFDPLAFMSANNLVEAYVGDPGAVVMQSMNKRFEIHDRGIEQGKAVSVETLIKEHEEQNKSKLEVVNE